MAVKSKKTDRVAVSAAEEELKSQTEGAAEVQPSKNKARASARSKKASVAGKAEAAPVPAEEPVPVVTVVPKKKILFVASESTPFIATGGLAEVIGSLSKALAANDDYDVRVVIPLYSDISWDLRTKFKYVGNLFVPLGWRNQYCGIFSYEANNVTFYFLDNEYYFKRPGCYGYMTTASVLPFSAAA